MVTVRQPPPCDLAPPAPTPPPTRPPAPEPDTVQAHEVWVEDTQSAAARLGLAARYGAGGIATWRLGLEDPRVWDAVAWWRSTVTPSE